jgi:hypothetical protein
MQSLPSVILRPELIVPLLVMLSYLAERLRYRRLSSFGEPIVLGVNAGWVRPLATLSLFVAGIGLIAAIPDLPRTKEEAVPSVAFLLDSSSWEGSMWSGEESSRNLSDCLQVMMQQIPATHFAVLDLQDETKSIVPPTSDSTGLLMTIVGWHPQARNTSGVGLPRAIGLMTEKKKEGRVSYTQFVIVSARSVAGVEQLGNALKQVSADVLYACPRTTDSPMRFGARAGDLWGWTTDARILSRSGDHSVPTAWPQRAGLSATQVFALLGFLLLSLESAWSFSGRKFGRAD